MEASRLLLMEAPSELLIGAPRVLLEVAHRELLGESCYGGVPGKFLGVLLGKLRGELLR